MAIKVGPMVRSARSVLVVLFLGLALALAPVTNAWAYTPPYHIRNFSGSNANLTIYANPGCSGSTHVLVPGAQAQSVGWDSIRSSRAYEKESYDDKTGNYIDTKRYAAGQCGSAGDNFYFVDVYG